MGKARKKERKKIMKKMKKFLAMMLAMAMVLGMSLTSFAEGEPKITISNVPVGDGVTVKYEKIASAEPTSPLGWKLEDGITLGNNVTLDDLTKVAGGNTNAATGTINSNENVAKAIADITLSKTVNPNSALEGATTTTAEITGVTPGLYVIEVQATGYTFTRMLAYVAWNEENTAAVENTLVQAKGAPNQVNKAITSGDNNSVSVGDIVPYTITAQYPYMAQNLTNKTFTITDTVTGGEINENVTVKVGEADQSNIVKLNENKDGFTATFTYDESKAGQTITITYNVEVTEKAESLENSVSSSFSYSEDGNETTTTTDAVVISPTVTATLEKVDGSDKALEGATFTLYVESSKDATHVLKDGKIVKATGTEATLKVVGTATTEINADGKATATFSKLDADKKYWVVETQAPDGYSLNDAAYELKDAEVIAGTPQLVKKGDTYTVNGEIKTATVDTMVTVNTVKSNFFINDNQAITNTKLASLPSTGGIGTTIFTIGGCAIMIIAAGLYFSLRRRTAK